MRSSRLLAIMMLLQVRGRVTADALAAEFEVSVRTIYRDIDALSVSGVPVFADRGPNGGFRLHEGYRAKLAGLTPSEAEVMLLAGLDHVVDDLGLGAAVQGARLKMLAAVSTEAGAAADRVSRRIHVDPTRWYRRRSAPRHLLSVAQAVLGGQQIKMSYTSWKGSVKRTLDPLGLVLKGDAWYLVARTNNQLRTYKVESILSVIVTSDSFPPPRSFDLASYWSATVQRFEQSLLKGQATLRLHEDVLCYVEELGSAAAETLHQAKSSASGWRRATIPIEGIPQAARILLGFGPSVEVVKPIALREALCEAAERIVSVYRPQTGQADVEVDQ
ncbi:MAG: YafY family transcriptional regulator [Rhizobiales bacterium]|nr:YafY family transcriptional regulator [Hyphomicrobiales bacterium]